jgi:hypothetical protein
VWAVNGRASSAIYPFLGWCWKCKVRSHRHSHMLVCARRLPPVSSPQHQVEIPADADTTCGSQVCPHLGLVFCFVFSDCSSCVCFASCMSARGPYGLLVHACGCACVRVYECQQRPCACTRACVHVRCGVRPCVHTCVVVCARRQVALRHDQLDGLSPTNCRRGFEGYILQQAVQRGVAGMPVSALQWAAPAFVGEAGVDGACH